MNHPPHSQAYPSTGEVIDGKYQIERMLGEGGMGAVAKATHLLRRAPVALKFMSPNVVAFPGAVERFLNEGVAASQIDSDHVVHIFDVGKLPNGAPYLVMEYMEGCDLSELLAREGRPGIEIGRAIHFTVQALRGLQVAHDAGIIHRDMKPSNCFVVHKDGEDDFVKLLDFGISKVQQGKSASLTQTNSALGTPLYMSPEQAKSPRDVDLRSDLYSVAVILYELLSGKTPFNSESGEFTEILFKLFTADPPPIRSLRPDVSPELAAVVHKGLARDVKDRFANAAEFGAALEPFAEARSARVISRLKAHQPGRGSQLPSMQHHADPAKQFSKLQTGSMAQGLAHDTERPPPGAPTAQSPQMVAHAQTPQPHGGAPQVTPQPQGGAAQQTPQPGSTPARHSAFPPGMSHRAASAEEAVAATQFNNTPSVLPSRIPHSDAPGTQQSAAPVQHLQPGARTDLGAARDAPPPARADKKPSPLIFAAPAILLLGLVGGGAYKMTHSSAGPAPTSTSIATDPTTPPALPPTIAPTASVAPTASAAPSSTASAAPSASSAPSAIPSSKPHAPPQPSQVTPPPTSTGRQPIRLKDLKPVE